MTRTVTYTNPCDGSSFLNYVDSPIGNPLKKIGFDITPGMAHVLTASNFLHDTGSLTYGAKDGWSLCAPFRTYTVDTNLLDHKIWIDSSSMVVTQGEDQFLAFNVGNFYWLRATNVVKFDVSMSLFGTTVDQ